MEINLREKCLVPIFKILYEMRTLKGRLVTYFPDFQKKRALKAIDPPKVPSFNMNLSTQTQSTGSIARSDSATLTIIEHSIRFLKISQLN